MTLLLHASTATCYLGLADGDQLIAQDSFSVDRAFASILADRIRQFLLTTNYSLQILQRIVVHVGPGSFTSLRIGVTTANAVAYALRIPVIGVSGHTTGLEELLERSKTLPSTTANSVVPAYNREPNIGPVPSA
ncbi:MAG: tRNA (adenosine(37)-N6)-threonylcarbamoyltransferase complex dimerization subunit type 1 TsaB [bacterium]|nr:tRNA (adenosine(37)-N6)-threonylcarbamoyltransferase complex dimerization subunit type 1 TsaB [bacterium]